MILLIYLKVGGQSMGLTDKEVVESRIKYGTNIITRLKHETFVQKYVASLGDPIIKILIIALGIKLVFLIRDFDWFETIGIVIAIFIASFISTISEYGSEKAFERLQSESSKIQCKAKRNNKESVISIDEVVKNDIIILESGDKISADGIIVDGKLYVDESTINGETKEKLKVVNDKVYRGTVVYTGHASMLVTEVGDKTFYGSIATELQTENIDSPLKLRLLKLAKIISKIGYISAFLVAFSYLFSVIVINNNFDINLIKESITNVPLLIGYILYALTLCVTVIVVCVPEGLPMMITLVLSSNMKRMLKSNVLVRKLVGIETAGNINILFTDKTGTLTKGELSVSGIMDGDGKVYDSLSALKNYPQYYQLIKLSFICNNDSVYNNGSIGGNSTDKALISFIKENSTYKVLSHIPFDSNNKYSSCVIDYNSRKLSLLKGAPEYVLKHSKFYYNNAGKVRPLSSCFYKKVESATNKGIRVLACSIDDILACLVFIKDELKVDTKKGLELINKAHIQTVMMTGDNKDTALSIGKEIGLYNDGDIVLTSSELNCITDLQLIKVLPKLKIVARALPCDKSRLIKVCQDNNLVVGMTGDGVNDAPALKKADVGFSMGSGTEVAKEASDIIILDDNLLSISSAVLFGRTIFKSIRKFIIFQLTVNLCAVSLSVVGPFIGFETPVTVIQMLWINMVMDTLAGLAFSFEPPLLEYLNEHPKHKNEPIINRYMLGEIVFTGLYSSLLCIVFLKSSFITSLFRSSDYLMTGFFGLFIFISIFNCFNARTNRLNLFAHLKENKIFVIIILFIVFVQIVLIYYGGSLFRTIGLNCKEFIYMLLISSTVIPVDWIRKIYLRISKKSTSV